MSLLDGPSASLRVNSAAACGTVTSDPCDISACVNPWIPAAMLPTPPTTSPVDTTIAGTPIAAPTPVALVMPPKTSPVKPPIVRASPPTICPMASPILASGVPWASTPAASSNPLPRAGERLTNLHAAQHRLARVSLLRLSSPFSSHFAAKGYPSEGQVSHLRYARIHSDDLFQMDDPTIARVAGCST
ncbi:uncharacterized protein SOCE836_100270 [Sorangium cellulosum]|uniref:Uncharacterized protein n=1 Tax=Sorangium cellulosum TaxID=56 RepID=A0A4V0NHT5_SORCE|nr:uncharacterized protein SOCE836_100270 [Sorangium cellulosum]WCQ97083.1 hypothetical protein NQZ70_09874 [Sorangium sp. Soce836]